jgi:hypothetical protein
MRIQKPSCLRKKKQACPERSGLPWKKQACPERSGRAEEKQQLQETTTSRYKKRMVSYVERALRPQNLKCCAFRYQDVRFQDSCALEKKSFALGRVISSSQK